MNYDYVECSKDTGKDTIYLGDLELISANKYGWQSFSVTNKKSLLVKYHPELKTLKVGGSIPYFMEGNNYKPDHKKTEEAFFILSDMICTNLFESIVKQFEFGKTFTTPQKPEFYLLNHTSMQEFKMNSWGIEGKEFKSALLNLKMYDAGKNIRQKLSKIEREKLSIEKGYSSKANLMRLEIKYLKPEIYFKNRTLTIGQLLGEEFTEKCREDLIKTYKQVEKPISYSLPQTKKAHSLQKVAILALQESIASSGENAFEVLKNKIKAIPDHVLGKEDKKNRIRALRQIFSTITKDEIKEFDLEQYLLDK